MSPVETPAWVKDAIFYQIFPDRFAKSERLPKPRNLESWDSPPTALGYKGGDLPGIVEHLDHLESLGVTALYLCPIFQSASNHRYHTHDYYRVDPLLGGDEGFVTLREALHARGMRLVLDGVFNHASRGFFYFNDILENGRASPYVDWFTITEFPPNAYDRRRPPGYAAWWGLHALPKFNVDNPAVREYLMRVGEHWLRRGIDGWRLDVPEEIKAHGFWQEFRRRAKAVNPQAYLVGEVWGPAEKFLRGDCFDGVMNYLFAEAAIAFTVGRQVNPRLVEGKGYNPARPLDARQYADRIDWLLGLYPWEIQLTQLNLLDSHDTARIITLANGDTAGAHLATLLLLTYPGAPCIYYGDEIGLAGGGSDHDSRRPFPWAHPQKWRTDILAYHQRLIALRKAHPALRSGTYHRLHAAGSMYVFGRRLGDERLVIAVNTAEETQTAEVPLAALAAPPAEWQALYPEPIPPLTHWQTPGSGERLALTLAPRSGLILGSSSNRAPLESPQSN